MALKAGALAEEHFSAQEKDFHSWDRAKKDSKPPSDKPIQKDRHNARNWKKDRSPPSDKSPPPEKSTLN